MKVEDASQRAWQTPSPAIWEPFSKQTFLDGGAPFGYFLVSTTYQPHILSLYRHAWIKVFENERHVFKQDRGAISIIAKRGIFPSYVLHCAHHLNLHNPVYTGKISCDLHSPPKILSFLMQLSVYIGSMHHRKRRGEPAYSHVTVFWRVYLKFAWVSIWFESIWSIWLEI